MTNCQLYLIPLNSIAGNSNYRSCNDVDATSGQVLFYFNFTFYKSVVQFEGVGGHPECGERTSHLQGRVDS